MAPDLSADVPPASPTASLTAGPHEPAGGMLERTQRFDWAQTPLGPVERWSRSLKTTVAMLLECQLPMYLAWGPEFTQIYNDAYTPILGGKHPAALGAPAPQTWHEIWPKIGPMWHEVLRGRAIGFDDFKLTIERYGYPEDCYFNFSYSAVHDDDGRPGGVLVTFAETTRRVLAERRYRFLDELAQAARHESSPGAVMKLTAAMLGRYLGVSRCAYARVHDDQDTFDLLGDYNDGVDSIVGRYRFTDFGAEVTRLMQVNEPYVNHDVDTDPVTAGSDLAAYRRTQIQSVICVPLHKGGRFVAAMAVHQATPRHWSDDEIALVRTVVDRCWDTLERLRADAALRDEARSLEILNRTGAALSAELDLAALVQRVTDAATELTGATFGSFFYNGVDERGEALMLYSLTGAPREAFEKLGHPRPTGLFGPTFRGAPPIRIADVSADPRYGHFAPHHGMPPGHLPVRSYLAVSVVARSGEVIGGLFFGHTEPGRFTERSERLAVGIASQAAIAIDNARLYASAQQAAQERTLLLDSERNARLEAERANTLKDQFLATLSHELRTPLSAIKGWVHILRRKLAGSDADLHKGLDVIDRATRTQVQLIDDLLDMSRISAGKLVLDLQPVAPADVVNAAVEVIAPTARAAGVALDADLAETGLLHGDASRLQQVVWNLLANAIKFTPQGGRVRVTLRSDDSHALIDVADTGVGIHPEALPHVFERFRQADGSITRRFGGLGLGLSIVRHLVELHGGTVTAHSAGEGQGATFRVRLPRLDTRRPGAPGEAVHAGPAPSASLHGVHILVVDDDADSRDLIRRLLEENGAEVDTAADAEAALQAVARGGYRLVVSDIGMPGTDGYQLLRQLRRLPPDQGGLVPAIALTAFARAEDRTRALAAGFDQHCTKPIDPPSLLATAALLAGKPR